MLLKAGQSLLLLGVVLVVAEARALTVYKRDAFRDIRWLGRGNTGVAVIQDSTALFYNPAGLGRSQAYGFTVLNPSVASNDNIVTSASEISHLTSGSKTLSERFSPLLGKPLVLQGSFFPSLVLSHLAFGFFDYADAFLLYRDPVSPALDVDVRNDYGLIFGGGYQVFKGLHLGASLRYYKRSAIFDEVTGDQLLYNSSGILQTLQSDGEAWGLNVGAQYEYKIDDRSSFSVGLAIEDLGDSSFISSGNYPPAPRQEQMINAGLAYSLKGSLVDAQILFDMRQLGNSDISYSKKVFAGLEVSLLFMDLRAGLFQGNWTAGMSIRALPFLEIDLASYAEELDSVGGLRNNRYYMLGLKAGFETNKDKKKKQKYSLDDL